MNPISPFAQQILRFSGVHNQVLAELETQTPRIKQDSKNLFGEQLDVFVKREDKSETGTVEFIAGQKDSKAIPYSSGLIRSLNRLLTGEDIQPASVMQRRAPEHSGDLFERTIERSN